MPEPHHHIDLDVETDEQGRTVLVARGDVDLQTAPTLRDRIEDLASPGETLVIDLREVTFMDSPGLGTLVHCDRLQRERGSRLVLRRPAGPVRELLDMVQIANVIEVEQ
jgi:anti-anti-sigma factor